MFRSFLNNFLPQLRSVQEVAEAILNQSRSQEPHILVSSQHRRLFIAVTLLKVLVGGSILERLLTVPEVLMHVLVLRDELVIAGHLTVLSHFFTHFIFTNFVFSLLGFSLFFCASCLRRHRRFLVVLALGGILLLQLLGVIVALVGTFTRGLQLFWAGLLAN